MAELARLKRVRAGHKGTATKWIGEVETLVTTVNGGASLDRLRLSQLKRGLQDQLETLKKLNNEVIALVDDETAIGEEIASSEDFKLTIYGAMFSIEQLEAKGATTTTSPLAPTTSPLAPTTSPLSSPPRATAPATHNRAKLPKLTLQHFHGDPTKWYSFWELYEAAVHSNEELTDVEKFTYLRSLLEKLALDAISGLALTSDNYQEAVEILETRYGNKQLIISKHMDILLDLQSVSSLSDVGALRRFYDKVESQIRSLRTLGQTTESYGSLLIPVLMKRLPSEFRLMLSRKISSEDWTVNSIMKELEDEVKAREHSSMTPKNNGDRRHPRLTGTTLLTGSRNATCCYCNRRGHSPETCHTVDKIDSRRDLLRKEGRCYTCLYKGHISVDCRGGHKCSACKGRHHVSICYKLGNKSLDSTEVQSSNSQDRTELQKVNAPLNPTASP